MKENSIFVINYINPSNVKETCAEIPTWGKNKAKAYQMVLELAKSALGRLETLPAGTKLEILYEEDRKEEAG